MSDTITIRVLGPDDVEVLDRVRPGTFDGELNPVYAWAFLSAGINAMVVALDMGTVIGFVSGTVILHPDKPRQFLINGLGLHPDFHESGIARRLLERICHVATDRGCAELKALAEAENKAARALFLGLGGEESTGHVMFTVDLPGA